MSGAGGLFDSPIPRWGPADVAVMLRDEYGLAGELSLLEGERDQNLLLVTETGRCTVKISNPAEPIDVLDMQQSALAHVAVVPGSPPVPGVVPTSDGRRLTVVERDGVEFPIRVLAFLEGEPLRARPRAVGRAEIGVTVARMQQSLQGFFHAAAGRHLLWDVRNVSDLRPMVEAVADSHLRRRVTEVLDMVEADVLPLLAALPAQVVHNDLNPDNVLVAGGVVSGVIDFGDMLHGPRVADLAVAAAYQLAGGAAPADAVDEVRSGYETLIELTEAERTVLADLVSVRLCQSIVIGAWRAERHPENAEYILGDAVESAAGLVAMSGRAAGPGPGAGLLTRRRASLAPGLRLSYRAPLHLVSGDGVWLRAADGRRYLDAYNNVVQIGHGHPEIARVLARQTRRLNTNTRYLTEEVVTYAERLTALLPEGLDVCYFASSGSEANDLALRVARTVTGAQGAVVTEHAYHGNTSAVMAMSPEELRPGEAPDWVATVPPPPAGDPAGSGNPHRAMQRAIAALQAVGREPAAVFFDTVFSSDGIHEATAEYLDASVAVVRAAGGLYVADEVQAGLGRVGSRFWGFAGGTAIPDIVTLGKPIGNGHPIGAVVTSHAIAERFAADGYYFSTFGGNSVSAAVGRAVLDVTARENLAARAEQVGEYLRKGIRGIHAGRLGDVRGAGLFIGIDVVDDGGRPDGGAAAALVEAIRERGVLIGRTGPAGHTLKIRPPLVFDAQHADLVIAAIRAALR